MLWRWLRGRYTKRMEDDQAKIKAILDMLNQEKGSKWEEVDGYHSLMSVTHKDGNYNFDLGSGMIVKGFFNYTTGEIRTFYFKAVTKE